MWKRKKSSTDPVKVHVSWTGGLYVDPDELRAKIRARTIQTLVSQELKRRQEGQEDDRQDEES